MEQRVRPRTQKSRNSRRAFLRRRRQQDLLTKTIIFVAILACVIGGAFFVKMLGSSKERADLNKYYGIEKEEQLAVIVDNKVVGAKGILSEGKPYIEYSVVRNYLNERFYVDANENLLLYTLPQGTIRAEVGSKEYTLQKENEQKEYVIFKIDGDTAYISLDFVQDYTNIKFSVYQKPNRVMIVSQWGEVTTAVVKKNTQIRTEQSSKSSILTDISKRDEVTIISSKDNWKKIRTEDGFIGFVKSSALKKAEVKKI